MKAVLAALAVTALATPLAAFAQTAPADPAQPAAPAVTPAPIPASIAACGAAPTAPTLPDIAGAKNAKDVSAATEQLNAFISAAQANLACRRDAITAERNQMLALQEQLKLQTESYNTDVRAVTELRNAFEAQVTAFNERQDRRR